MQIGIDSSLFTKGQQTIVRQIKQLEDEVTRRGENTEHAFHGIADAIGSVRNRFMRLGAAVVGAAGFEQLVVHTVANTAAMGRFSSVVGVSTELLSKWQNVGKIVTGTTEGMAEAIGGAVRQFAGLSILGNAAAVPFLNALQGLTGTDFRRFLDSRGELKDVTGYFLALSDAFFKMRDRPGEIGIFAEGLGLPQNLVEVLRKGPDALRKMLADVEALGPATAKDAAEAQKVVEAWGRAQVAVQPITRSLSLFGAEFMVTFANGLTNLFKILQHPTLGFGLNDLIQPGSLLGNYRDRFNALHPSEGLPVKSGAGSQSVGTAALARSIFNNVSGINQFTSFNDDFHKGRQSPHNQDRAIDFTLSESSNANYAATAAKVRAYLASMGINATVIDEANFPSPGATGPHLHVQFNSAAAAQKYADAARTTGGTSSTTNSSSAETNIGAINVNMMGTNDPKKVANEIVAAVERRQKAAAAANAVN